MKHVYILSVLLLTFVACSEEAQPYEEINTSIVKQAEGHIQTH